MGGSCADGQGRTGQGSLVKGRAVWSRAITAPLCHHPVIGGHIVAQKLKCILWVLFTWESLTMQTWGSGRVQVTGQIYSHIHDKNSIIFCDFLLLFHC